MRERMTKFLPRYAICLCIIMLLMQNAGHAQKLQYLSQQNSLKSSASDAGGNILSFASPVGGDILHVFSSPFRLNPKSGVKFLTLAAITTASVVWLDRDIDDDFIERESRSHWGTDVLVGGALGYGVGSTLVNRYKQPAKSSLLNPYMMGNRVGLFVVF